MDNSVKVWDIRPYVVGGDDSNRCTQTMYGIQHNFEKNLLRCSWNHAGTMVTAGSADRFVCVWDVSMGGTDSAKMVQRLGGHHGSVNEVVFNPNPGHANLLASCSSDKSIYIGEL